MATPTYDLLDSVTLTSSASSVTFSSIDQSYGDLIIVTDGVASENTNGKVVLNGDTTGTNYFRVRMRGASAGPNSGTNNSNTELLEQIGPSGFFAKIQIMDYSATDKHTSMLVNLNKDTTFVYALAARWANTSAVTSVQISAAAGTLNAGTTVNLYGVAK